MIGHWGVSVPVFVRVRFKSAVFSNRLTTTLLSTVTLVKIPINVCFKGILTDHAVAAKLICVFVFAYAKSRLLSWLTKESDFPIWNKYCCGLSLVGKKAN